MQYYSSQAKTIDKLTPWNDCISPSLPFFFCCPFSFLFSPSFSFFPLLSHSFFLDYPSPRPLLLLFSFKLLFLPLPYPLFPAILLEFLEKAPLVWSVAAVEGMVLKDQALFGKIQNWDHNRKGSGRGQEWSIFSNRRRDGEPHSVRAERSALLLPWTWEACTPSLVRCRPGALGVAEAWGWGRSSGWVLLSFIPLSYSFPYLFLAFFLSLLYSIFFMELSMNMVEIKNI